MAERDKSKIVRPNPGAAKPSPQAHIPEWDARHCGWCGHEQLTMIGGVVDGLANFRCDGCSKTQEAVMDYVAGVLQPVARIFPEDGPETVGYRHGDDPPPGMRPLPSKLPCGCRRRRSELLNDGSRKCKVHGKRFNLALAFVEVA